MAASPPRLVAIGNSHMDALRFAAPPESAVEKYGFSIDYLSTLDAKYDPLFHRIDGEWVANEDFCKDARALLHRAKPDLVLAFVSDLFQFHHGTYALERPFDFVLPERLDLGLAQGCEIVPYDLIREAARRANQQWPALLATIVAGASLAPVYAVRPPPPIVDFAPFHDEMTEKVKARGAAPDSLRYKLWRVQIGDEREQAEALGARVLPSPPEVETESGLRRVEYSHDILHGDLKYGALIALQAKACLSAWRPEA